MSSSGVLKHPPLPIFLRQETDDNHLVPDPMNMMEERTPPHFRSEMKFLIDLCDADQHFCGEETLFTRAACSSAP